MEDIEIKNIINSSIDAMMDGNRVKFADAIDALMTDKANDAIDAYREGMAERIFDFGEVEEDPLEFEDEVEIDDEEIEDESVEEE